MPKITSFDTFLKEHRATRNEEPFEIVIEDKIYALSATLPAIIILRVMRLQKEMGADAAIPPDEVLTMADALFGKGLLEEIASTHNLDLNELGQLIKMVVSSYTASVSEQTGGENANPTAVGTSSPNGTTLNPISNGNTEST